MAEFLLERGATVAWPDDLAWATPIALATYRGHSAIVRVLKALDRPGIHDRPRRSGPVGGSGPGREAGG